MIGLGNLNSAGEETYALCLSFCVESNVLLYRQLFASSVGEMTPQIDSQGSQQTLLFP